MRKVIFLLLFAICYLLFVVPLFAESNQELYSHANLNYEGQRYEEAIRLYEEILKTGKECADIYYNLGNSYFKSKHLGKAILNYERAIRLAPRDSDIRKNLALARKLIKDKIEISERGFILSLIFILYDNLNLDEITVLVSLIFFSIIILLILSIYLDKARRGIFAFVSVLSGIFVFVSIFLVAKLHAQNFTKEAIIVVEKVDVRSGPKEDYLLQFTLHEGTKLKIVNDREDWFEIDLSKDLKGWLPKDTVEVI